MGTVMRVMLASDQPEMRRFLGTVVEKKMGGVVVGEGENGIITLSLARRLRPDMAIIDSYLPHTVGLRNVLLSRNAGLDVAQAISAEIPNVQVVLLDGTCSDLAYNGGAEAVMYPYPDMSHAETNHRVTFASIQGRPPAHRNLVFSDICVTGGMSTLLLGLVLTATTFLAYVGFPFIILGMASLLVGCVGKIVTISRKQETSSREESGATGCGAKGG